MRVCCMDKHNIVKIHVQRTCSILITKDVVINLKGESSFKKDKTVGPWQQLPAASQATSGIYINSYQLYILPIIIFRLGS